MNYLYTLLAGLLIGLGGGWQIESWRADAERLAAIQQQNRAIHQAQERADAAQVALDQARKTNAATARKMRSAIELATGRECLSALVVDRLRNSPDSGVPDTSSTADRPRTGSDDRAVIDAIERLTQYGSDCRAQVNAIRQAVTP